MVDKSEVSAICPGKLLTVLRQPLPALRVMYQETMHHLARHESLSDLLIMLTYTIHMYKPNIIAKPRLSCHTPAQDSRL